ncbi:prominin-2-like [Amphiura filiformis]|uniref:prominin-2-like n=1 Tax=Amphiura filiformis TaxID=82378 RepID=UPI003B2287C4
MINVKNQTAKLIDEIDIGDVDLSDLVPDNLGPLLQYSVDQIQLDQIDYVVMETLLQENVTTDDLNAYSRELQTTADNNALVADDLRQVASDLRQIQQNTVQVMENTMASMLSDSQLLQALIPQLELAVNETGKAGIVVESNLNDTKVLEEVLDASVSSYLDVVIGYMQQFVDVAIDQLIYDFGRCYPIRTIYDATINLMCHYDLESLNTLWFSLGWIVFWMTISLIFAVKLAKYLRRMDFVKLPKNQVDRVRTYSDDYDDGLSHYDNQAYYSLNQGGSGNQGVSSNHSNMVNEDHEMIQVIGGSAGHNNEKSGAWSQPYLPPPPYDEIDV